MTSGPWSARVLSSSPQEILSTIEAVLKAENLQLSKTSEKSLLGPLRSAAATGIFPSPLPFPLATTVAQAKRQAKALFEALSVSGYAVNLTTSQHLIARFYKYTSWQHFVADARRKPGITDKQTTTRATARDRRDAAQIVNNWLCSKLHPHRLTTILEPFFGPLTRGDLVKIEMLPEQLKRQIDMNQADWLLADAVTPEDGRPLIDLYLGPEGPALSGPQRAWLKKVAERPLGLYEIVGKKGENLTLRDAISEDKIFQCTVEKVGSKHISKGDYLGGRLVHDGEWVLSGSPYLFEWELGLDLIKHMKHSIPLAQKAHNWPYDLAYAKIAAMAIPSIWLGILAEGLSLPHIVDAATGEDLAMVFDSYAIRNLRTIVTVFKERDDVAGDAEEGWARFKNGPNGALASTMKIDAEGNLEVWSRCVGTANETKWWLETVVGTAVASGARKIVETASEEFWIMMGETTAKMEALSESDRKLEKVVGDHFLADHYRKWIDTPIPALGGETPRHTSKTPAGRKELDKLLRHMEKLSAANPQTAGFDFDWLRKELGLDS